MSSQTENHDCWRQTLPLSGNVVLSPQTETSRAEVLVMTQSSYRLQTLSFELPDGIFITACAKRFHTGVVSQPVSQEARGIYDTSFARTRTPVSCGHPCAEESPVAVQGTAPLAQCMSSSNGILNVHVDAL